MLRRFVSSLLLVVLLYLIAAVPVPAAETEPYHQTDFPAEEFQSRWATVFDKIGNQAVAVLQGVPQTNGFIFPRQSNDFYYLSGIETPGSYLLLDGRTRKASLYLPPRNLRTEAAEGKVLSADDVELAKRITGADEVLSVDAMRGDWLRTSGNAPQIIDTPFAPAEEAEQSRYELMASNAAIASDYFGMPAFPAKLILLACCAPASGAVKYGTSRPFSTKCAA
jgi:Xaa-Pro aminopeptidase